MTCSHQPIFYILDFFGVAKFVEQGFPKNPKTKKRPEKIRETKADVDGKIRNQNFCTLFCVFNLGRTKQIVPNLT